jgi:hypothetical protein
MSSGGRARATGHEMMDAAVDLWWWWWIPLRDSDGRFLPFRALVALT